MRDHMQQSGLQARRQVGFGIEVTTTRRFTVHSNPLATSGRKSWERKAAEPGWGRLVGPEGIIRPLRQTFAAGKLGTWAGGVR
jgi:hypothetical protein